jgi:hypothetical protein
MTVKEVESSVVRVNKDVLSLVNEREDKILSLANNVYNAVLTKQKETEINVSLINLQLQNYTYQLNLNAYYHYLKSAIDPDPGFIAIVLGVYNVIKSVVTFIQMIVNSKVFQVLLLIHKILVTVWPDYKKATDRIIKNVSDFSKQVGMGADGLHHLLSAVASTAGMITGLAGEKTDFTAQQWYIKSNKTLQLISNVANTWSVDPIGHLTSISWYSGVADQEAMNKWWTETSEWINSGINDVAKSVQDITGITDDLQQAISLMPQFVQENIPSWVQDGLNNVNDLINESINPALNQVRQQVNIINNVLNEYKINIHNLQNGLLNPGVTLLRVDDLNAVEKERQLAMIDDVTSRDFVEQTTKDREGLSNTIDTLDSIVEALTAPTPEPQQYSLESVPGRPKPEITIEAHETWMVGGYNSPY